VARSFGLLGLKGARPRRRIDNRRLLLLKERGHRWRLSMHELMTLLDTAWPLHVTDTT
jgi:hypothetical protein